MPSLVGSEMCIRDRYYKIQKPSGMAKLSLNQQKFEDDYYKRITNAYCHNEDFQQDDFKLLFMPLKPTDIQKQLGEDKYNTKRKYNTMRNGRSLSRQLEYNRGIYELTRLK
eukprot:TRINITY_DN6556_c0_g1_i2.p2 TRINITY_DN6556_c0_g1~~TRINITY_DN6556_c0_g1_i2.p2  ORF type:complete len:111 (-),score=24.51 TRINITY_DN6556_c0_g1_i2:135-467(-)